MSSPAGFTTGSSSSLGGPGAGATMMGFKILGGGSTTVLIVLEVTETSVAPAGTICGVPGSGRGASIAGPAVGSVGSVGSADSDPLDPLLPLGSVSLPLAGSF